MMYPKAGVTRLTGKALAELNDRIYHRDGGRCVLCGALVPYGTKFHHIKFKSQGGGDTIDNGATLCQTGNNCHGQAHGPKAKEIRAKLLRYVKKSA
jgi:5-methylcytosine-specific restriction endonuclease McrA